MQTTDVLKSSVLLIVGAGASALGFLAARDGERHEVALASDQVQLIVARLGSLEEHLLTGIESSRRSVGVDAVPTPVARTQDRDDDTLRLLSEIRNELKMLVHGVSYDTSQSGAGVSKKAEVLAKTLEVDGADSKKFMQRHFCQTPAQVYATYGMPDMKDGGVGVQYFRYRVDGTGWIVFQFIDGVVFDVTINPGSGR